MRHDESRLQQACVTWFRLQYPKLALCLVANPNGGARNKLEAAIMKGEGVTAGVADLTLYVMRHGYGALLVEMKTPQGRQSPAQKVWQAAVEAQGYKYVICRSIEDFMAEINSYLNTC